MTATTERSSFIPDTLEALVDYLEVQGWTWKVKGYFDDGGHRTYCGVVYRREWPRGYGCKKQYAQTAHEALRAALKHGFGKAEELKRQQGAA